MHVPRIERYSENSGDVNWSLIFSRVYKVCLDVNLIEFNTAFYMIYFFGSTHGNFEKIGYIHFVMKKLKI